MKYRKWLYIILSIMLLTGIVYLGGTYLYLQHHDGDFQREISDGEASLRLNLVQQAQSWLGTSEGTAGHEQIIRIYNAHEPLAQGYAVTTDDNWCAAFASAVAIETGKTQIIPTECGCQRQIDLWKNLGRWTELDTYLPLPGDYIYYAWDEGWDLGDCIGWADHVGIVVGTAGPWIKVIEGNKNDMVAYRIVSRWNMTIRGYGLPDYTSQIP